MLSGVCDVCLTGGAKGMLRALQHSKNLDALIMRLLHTMLRVGDLEKSLAFYTDILGMNLLRKNDYPEGKFTLAFVGYGSEEDTAVLELTHNWETQDYTHGNAFGHIAIGVDDVYDACNKIKAAGGKVVREAGPMQHSTTILAFVEDPDGYKIELLMNNRSR